MNPIGEWARLVLGALADAGVTDVVISPGSRSTPFTYAAAVESRLRCHDVVDERTAGFLALGRAKVSGRPVALLCTSGTAAAHYYPAVIEASASFTPLIVLSVDRPLSLQDCGANQTIDQVKIFGDHVRHFADLGLPRLSEDALRGARRAVVQAVATSLQPTRGPVHLELRADKPLEPGPPEDESERKQEAIAAQVAREPVTRHWAGRTVPDREPMEQVARALVEAERGLIVCGPGPLSRRGHREAVFDLARRTGFALCADATSQLRFAAADRVDVPVLDMLELVLRSKSGRRRLSPDMVVQLGAGPISTAWDTFLRAQDTRSVDRVVLAEHGWPDPQGSARALIRGDEAEMVRTLLGALDVRGPGSFAQEARSIHRRTLEAVERELGRTTGELTEGGVARSVLGGMPDGGLLSLGNSLPVRAVDRWCEGDLCDVPVLSQRGASGIDGLVSSAVGAALESGRPTALLLGDVSFIHDVGGLATARDLEVPLTVVIVNNDGGRIFEQLPIARAPHLASELTHFTTPHGLSFEHAASLYGHRYQRPPTPESFDAAFGQAMERPGCTVIEAVVPPHGALAQDQRLLAAVDEALEAM